MRRILFILLICLKSCVSAFAQDNSRLKLIVLIDGKLVESCMLTVVPKDINNNATDSVKLAYCLYGDVVYLNPDELNLIKKGNHVDITLEMYSINFGDVNIKFPLQTKYFNGEIIVIGLHKRRLSFLHKSKYYYEVRTLKGNGRFYAGWYGKKHIKKKLFYGE